jgi:hypothetical protein
MIIKSYKLFVENLNLLANASIIAKDIAKDKTVGAIDKTKVTNPNDPNSILKDTIKKIAVDGTKSIKDKITTATKMKSDLERLFTSTDAKGNLAQTDEEVKKNLEEILKKNSDNKILKDLINSLSLKRELKQLEIKKKGTEDRIDTLKAREIESAGKPTDDIKKTEKEVENDLSGIVAKIANLSKRITDAETEFNKDKKELDEEVKKSEQESKGIAPK